MTDDAPRNPFTTADAWAGAFKLSLARSYCLRIQWMDDGAHRHFQSDPYIH